MSEALDVPKAIFKDLQEKFKLPLGEVRYNHPQFPALCGNFPALRFEQDGCFVFLQQAPRISRLVLGIPQEDVEIVRGGGQKKMNPAMIISGGSFIISPPQPGTDTGVVLESDVRITPFAGFSFFKSNVLQLYGYLVARSAQVFREMGLEKITMSERDFRLRYPLAQKDPLLAGKGVEI